MPDGPNRSAWREDDRVWSEKSPGKVNAEHTPTCEPFFHFAQDECWTSSKQSQVWSSTCHGQWWWWWPWWPIIFPNTLIQIFCKILWSRSNDHPKSLHIAILTDTGFSLWWPYSYRGAVICKKSNSRQLETSLKYSCNASNHFFYIQISTTSSKSRGENKKR